MRDASFMYTNVRVSRWLYSYQRAQRAELFCCSVPFIFGNATQLLLPASSINNLIDYLLTVELLRRRQGHSVRQSSWTNMRHGLSNERPLRRRLQSLRIRRGTDQHRWFAAVCSWGTTSFIAVSATLTLYLLELNCQIARLSSIE